MSAPSTAMPPAAAMSWRSPPITSCWWTTAARRWRCRRRRCSLCCPAPAGSPASPTSAKCGATAPTCSARSRRASAAARRSNGGWSTKWCPIRSGKTWWRRARTKSPRVRTGRQDAKGIALTPLDRKIEADRVAYSHVDVEIDRARGLATRHRARTLAKRSGLGRSRACARRQVLAAHRGARTGRRHPASARQRAGHRRPAVAHRRQCARRAGSRRFPWQG